MMIGEFSGLGLDDGPKAADSEISAALGLNTKLPTCGRTTTSPCDCNRLIASRTGVRLTPNDCASISSAMTAPSLSSPSMMAWRSRTMTFCDSDFGASSLNDLIGQITFPGLSR
jgi:hypothetical protein